MCRGAWLVGSAESGECNCGIEQRNTVSVCWFSGRWADFPLDTLVASRALIDVLCTFTSLFQPGEAGSMFLEELLKVRAVTGWIGEDAFID
jgi:hypothetical protein